MYEKLIANDAIDTGTRDWVIGLYLVNYFVLH